MFKRYHCPRCDKKSATGGSFCPHCGRRKNAAQTKEDWGLLGKKDQKEQEKVDLGLPFGFNNIFNTLLKQMTKEMEKELRRAQQEGNQGPNGIPRNGISISISSKQGQPPEIRINNQGQPSAQEEALEAEDDGQQEIIEKRFAKESLKRFSTLPRKEPQTSVRRLADSVFYEIDLPEVTSLDDIAIKKLENSIEVRAVAKDHAYDKIIQVGLPIIDMKLRKGKLILELDGRM